MKGLHTQGLVVLFRALPELDALLAALAPFGPTATPATDTGWMGGAPGARLPGPRGGTVVVHAFPAPWPDTMGDPKGDPTLFGAWSMGFLGPYTFPGGLERAVQQAWHWPEARDFVPRHTGFVRILVTYVADGGPDALVRPPDYDAREELDFVTRLAVAVSALPGAVAYFDPNGEVVLSPSDLAQRVEEGRTGPAPLDVWANVRLFRIADVAPWTIMDTVGLGQLDCQDLEACFPGNRHDAGDVANFLRNVSLYLLDHGNVVKDGHTVDGPGGPWRAHAADDALVQPPRETLRFAPVDAGALPEPLRRGLPEPEPAPAPATKPSFWKRILGRA